ncbi:MAG: DNA polymerase V subunit UmuC, partial [Succinivibrionaceae bacterium]
MKNCFALIDCNNFFVSCERLFRPDLRNKPVIVLSNNDGCVISRSNEAKSLGIPMGVPLFKIKHLVKKYNIQIFSTNFNLYLDISKRVNAILSTFSPYHENYSIDESFLDLTGFKKQYNIYDYCHNINYIVTKSTGIPVCVGAGPTKTLAKIANYGAKKGLILGGVLTIDTEEERIQLLKKTPLYDVWGIGKSFFEKLSKDFNLKTAYDLSLYDP